LQPSRIPVIAAAAGLLVTLAGTLSACGGSSLSSAASAHRSASDRSTSASLEGSPPAASSPDPSSPGGSVPSPPSTAAPPDIILVRLATTFSPAVLQVGVGQQFLVSVAKSVQVSGLDAPGSCTQGKTVQIPGGRLSLRCLGGGGYLYTAEQAGPAALSATVRPRCAPGAACPQWITKASLKITIT